MSRSQRDAEAFVVTCEDCAVETRTDDPNETVAFYRRHRSATGHDVVWEGADAAALDGLDVPADADLAAVVRALDGAYEGGVPLGVVAAAMGERGATMAETFEAVHDLRMTGGLYEPRDDHLRPF
ncbi:hypothetical protein [Halomarina litorea]|uniref:hypothetical protein n=1 Tax=Halomarina litorea TaxID=2961595 RepID=UPI0020C40CF8|nr:hypothetical protein [Halomarina sp. BCD28]